MSERNGGGAFPQIETDGEEFRETGYPIGRTYSYGGMSLRDYFAAAALQGLAARMDSAARHKYVSGHAEGREAFVAYALADAMLKEREK